MTTRRRLLSATLTIALCASGLSVAVAADDTIKVGVLTHDTGPFAVAGQQFRMGIETYVAQHGTTAGGRQVEFVYKDIGGPNPATAKRLAEELIVRDKVSILAGFYLTSDASAVASVVNQAKVPSVLFVGASPTLLKQSPYFLRIGQHIGQSASAGATFALKHGKKTAYIAVADYAPGHDVQSAFRQTFTAGGGTIVGEDRIPLNTIDFAAFAERIKTANPDVVDIFVPPGAPAIGFSKALAANGTLKNAMVIGMGEADDNDLGLFDDSIVGFYQALYYGAAVDNPENTAFKTALQKKFGAEAQANFMTVSAYDGAAEVYRMVESQKGKPFDGASAMKSLDSYSWKSPRGPVTTDSETRELTQNIYIRQTVKVDGKLQNKVVETFTAVKAPAAPQP